MSNSSNKPVHMYPQLPEGEISSGLHTYVARQVGRQTGRPTNRQTDGIYIAYTFTRSPFFKATAVSDLSGEKWQTQLSRDTQVGNAIPANTAAITQEALIRTNSGLAGYMHVNCGPYLPVIARYLMTSDIGQKTTHTVGDLRNT